MPETYEHDHNHHGTTPTLVKKDDAQIRLKCVELAIECEARAVFGAAEGSSLRAEADIIYDWVTQGEK